VSSAYELDKSLFDVLKKKLRKPQTVLSSVRVARRHSLNCSTQRSAFPCFAASRRTSDTSFGKTRREGVYATRSTRQVFDEGDRVTVDAIELLRESADKAVQRNRACDCCGASGMLPKARQTPA